MYTFFIEKYINRLSLEDFATLAKNQGISFIENELEYCYQLVKNNWKDFYQGDREKFLNQVKKNVSDKTFKEIMKVYQRYQDKIK